MTRIMRWVSLFRILQLVECHFEELRQRYPRILTANYYCRYEFMQKALKDLSAYAVLAAVTANVRSLNVKQTFETPKDKDLVSKSTESPPQKVNAPSTVIDFEVVSTKAKATVNGTSPGSTSSLTSNAPAVTVVKASSENTERKTQCRLKPRTDYVLV